MKTAIHISLGVVLALALMAGSAAAERVWTKTTTSLRADPDQQSRRVARIQANRSLTVVSKQGRWLKVKSGAKSGWVHRSEVRVRGRGGRDGVADARPPRPRGTGESSAADVSGASDETSSDATASSGGSEPDDGDVSASDEGSEEPCRKDAVWCGRDRKDDALHVQVLLDRVQVYKEPGVNQEIAFWVTKGEELVIIGYHRPDWFYIQTLKGKFGWIPKSAIRQEGNLVDPDAEDQASRIEALPDLDPRSVKQEDAPPQPDGESRAGETRSEDEPERMRIAAVAAVGGALLGRSFSGGGQADYEASATGAATHLSADIRYHVSGSWYAGAQGIYTAMLSVPGMTYTASGAADADVGSFLLHRFDAVGKFGYVDGFAAFLRAGILIETFYLNEIFNPGKLPRERLISPTVGLELSKPDLVAGLGVAVQADVLLGGALAQTGGLEDGDFDGLSAVAGLLDISYPLGERLEFHGIYRFDLVSPTWVGASSRAAGVNGASRSDQSHRVLMGVGMHF